jgi:transposase-like protein
MAARRTYPPELRERAVAASLRASSASQPSIRTMNK